MNDAEDGWTLFVRNIDYNATEDDLKEFFGDSGEVLFVNLVKSRENPDVHKGWAFVKFKEKEPVETLAKLSNDYWGTQKHLALKSDFNDMAAQLEFRNRRMVMFKAESRDQREKVQEKEEEKKDKRNKDLAKEGLVTTKDFVHEDVPEIDMKARVRLFRDKQYNLKKNPNLFVSKTRLWIRNLDKRMNETELKEICKSFTDDWVETLEEKDKKGLKQTKLIHQYKILKDPNDLDEEGNPKSCKIGFIEVSDHRLGLYLIRNMNNFVVNPRTKRGIIMDFTLEDHRKLLKRKQKLESQHKKQKIEKESKEGKPVRKPKKDKKKQEEKSKLKTLNS